MARKKRKKEQEEDVGSADFADVYRPPARKQTATDLLWPSGPYDREGHMTGQRPDGSLYDILLPSKGHRCPVEGQEFASRELLELHRRANHPGPLRRLARRLRRPKADPEENEDEDED